MPESQTAAELIRLRQLMREKAADEMNRRTAIKARAKEICRLADGSPCAGPDTDCEPSNCHAMAQANVECSHE